LTGGAQPTTQTPHHVPPKTPAFLFRPCRFSNAERRRPGSAAPRRINPWRKFIGSIVPNWLQCRREINQGAKLAYARLAQYAGKDGACFPKQETLAVELGVSERTANEYVRTLVRLGLIETDRPGRGLSNRYFFLDHPWIYECRPEAPSNSVQEPQEPSAPNRKNSSGQERQEPSAPYTKENQGEMNQRKRVFPHSPPKGDSVRDPGSTSSQEEQIYDAYPKKVGRPAALRAIRRALAKHPFDFLLECTRRYAQTCNSPADFIPHPSTWFNQERFNDDSATWQRTGPMNDKAKSSPPRQFNREDYKQDVSNF